MAILASHAMQPAQQAVEHYGWLKPGEMLDGLGMAETTPGPLIMVLQFVGFMAAYREPGSLAPILAGTLGGLLATLGHVHPVLSLDLSRRTVRREAARQRGPQRGSARARARRWRPTSFNFRLSRLPPPEDPFC
jgi:Chromate transporter